MFTNEAMGSEASRLAFAGDCLSGDASLLISDLLLTDSGEYSCKVKSGGKVNWNRVNLIVLGERRQSLVHGQIRLRHTRARAHRHNGGSLGGRTSSVTLPDLMIRFESDAVI